MKIESETDSLRALKPNWDGYGAPAIDEDCIYRASKVTRALMALGCEEPSIVPCPSGGVQLEWHSCGWDLEMELAPGDEGDDYIDASNENED